MKGKARIDKFYKKAKEEGYRARAAYKLIQLNKLHGFLQRSRVCIDLCASPGSWLQVAQRFMPASSIIVGVDLLPITPIPNVITIQGDITTDSVRHELKSALKTWKADVVLHDGSPNVGQNWIHDAYQQNILTLHAFRIACEFLQKGGRFVTKVFRSKDYFSLEFAFRKLFKKVEATKPQASRHESAEIYIVCLGYLAPDKIDPQFFDQRSIFQEVEPEQKRLPGLGKPEKGKKKALGYEEGITMLYKSVTAEEFVKSENFVQMLQEVSEIIFEDDAIRNDPLTTDEIAEYCKDVKVLGRRELKLILKWRKSILSKQGAEEKGGEVELMQQATKPGKEETEASHSEKAPEEKSQELKELDELDKVGQELQKLSEEKARLAKSAVKKVQKEKKKLKQRMNLKLLVDGDSGPQEEPDKGLFQLQKLSGVTDVDAIADDEDMEGLETEEKEKPRLPKYVTYDRERTFLSSSGLHYKTYEDTSSESEEAADSDKDPDEEEEEEAGSDEGLALDDNDAEPKSKVKKSVSFASDVEEDSPSDSEDEDMETSVNDADSLPLVTDLVGDVKSERKLRRAEMWFQKDVFNELDDTIEDYELKRAIQDYKKSGGMISTKRPVSLNSASGADASADAASSNSEDEPDEDTSDSGTDDLTPPKKEKEDSEREVNGTAAGEDQRQGQTEGGTKASKTTVRKLTPEALALATKFIHSKKARRDIIDASWNRYMQGYENLPSWFIRDEKEFNNPRIEVDPEDLRMYRDRCKGVNVRTLKKVAEAKARKKRRAQKRLQKAQEKADTVMNDPDMSEREKALELKRIYKKAEAPKNTRRKQLIVMKKFHAGKKPSGIKGRVKLVDRRMKKDMRAQERLTMKKGGRKGKRKIRQQHRKRF